MNDDFEEFDPRFYTKWERTLMEDDEAHILFYGNNLNRREYMNTLISENGSVEFVQAYHPR